MDQDRCTYQEFWFQEKSHIVNCTKKVKPGDSKVFSLLGDIRLHGNRQRWDGKVNIWEGKIMFDSLKSHLITLAEMMLAMGYTEISYSMSQGKDGKAPAIRITKAVQFKEPEGD